MPPCFSIHSTSPSSASAGYTKLATCCCRVSAAEEAFPASLTTARVTWSIAMIVNNNHYHEKSRSNIGFFFLGNIHLLI